MLQKEQKNLLEKECGQMDHDYLGFEDTLDESDYGFILDKDGNLKGIWIPKGSDDEEVPEAIVELIKEHWGIDPNDDSLYNGTIH